jgi:putative transposase
MGRQVRIAPGGVVFHVLNRSAGKFKFLSREKDFQAFENVLLEAHARHPLQIFSYCVLATHWHFVVRPEKDGDLTAFFRWLTHTHAMRWRVSHHTVGYGHLYQGRFKSFPVEQDEHFLNVCRYVERNALTAGLVTRAEQWRWGSLWAREHGAKELRAILGSWPADRPADWTRHVNEAIGGKELDRLRSSLERGRPYGSESWVLRTATRFRMEHTIRPEGRPAKKKNPSRIAD